MGVAPFDITGAISGPPHELAILDKTRNAIFAVVGSSASLAKCSMVEMTVSKIGWLARKSIRDEMLLETRSVTYSR